MPKPKYRVRLLTAAEQDFKEIIDYILADNAAVALSIADKIETNLNLLENNPQLGRIPNDDELLRLGYRYLIALDYLIFYKIEGNTIFVYRILHGARNYKSLLLPSFFCAPNGPELSCGNEVPQQRKPVRAS